MTLATGTHALAADGVLGWINGLLDGLGTTAGKAVAVMSVCLVLYVGHRGRWSFPAVVMGIFLGGLLYWGGHNIGTVSDKVDQDMKPSTQASAVRLVTGVTPDA